MTETRKIAAILVADVVGYSRLAGADEDRTLATAPGAAQRPDRPDDRRASRARRQAHRRRRSRRVPQRGRRGALRDRSAERHGRAQRRPAARTTHRVSASAFISGDVVEESDGDLMGDGVNIAARLEGVAEPGAICLSEDAYRQVKGRLDLPVQRSRRELNSRTSPSRSGSIRSKLASQRKRSPRRSQRPKNPARRASRSSSCRSPILAATPNRSISSMGSQRASRPTSHGYAAPS